MAVQVIFKPAAFPDPPETVVLELEHKCGARRSGTDSDLCVFVSVPKKDRARTAVSRGHTVTDKNHPVRAPKRIRGLLPQRLVEGTHSSPTDDSREHRFLCVGRIRLIHGGTTPPPGNVVSSTRLG